MGDEGFCFGREPGLADVYLVPQLYAAHRLEVALDTYSRILRVEQFSPRTTKRSVVPIPPRSWMRSRIPGLVLTGAAL
ncbi:hypothetical protein [Microvirga sp. KLBC 81]|uniref:hypothetical protein n=1 Tax=Microvirga sp. KLBC 81 TaxID=1862707 RepID=UPI00352EEA46